MKTQSVTLELGSTRDDYFLKGEPFLCRRAALKMFDIDWVPEKVIVTVKHREQDETEAGVMMKPATGGRFSEFDLTCPAKMCRAIVGYENRFIYRRFLSWLGGVAGNHSWVYATVEPIGQPAHVKAPKPKASSPWTKPLTIDSL